MQVWICDTKFSDLVILSYIVASKKSIKTFNYYSIPSHCKLQQIVHAA